MIQSIRFESPATGSWKKTLVAVVGSIVYFPAAPTGFGAFDRDSKKFLGTVKPGLDVLEPLKAAIEGDRRVERIEPGDTAPAPVPGGWSGFGGALAREFPETIGSRLKRAREAFDNARPAEVAALGDVLQAVEAEARAAGLDFESAFEPERPEVANDLGEGLGVEVSIDEPKSDFERPEVVGRVRNVKPKK